MPAQKLQSPSKIIRNGGPNNKVTPLFPLTTSQPNQPQTTRTNSLANSLRPLSPQPPVAMASSSASTLPSNNSVALDDHDDLEEFHRIAATQKNRKYHDLVRMILVITVPVCALVVSCSMALHNSTLKYAETIEAHDALICIQRVGKCNIIQS